MTTINNFIGFLFFYRGNNKACYFQTRGSCHLGANKLCRFKYRGSYNIGADKLCSFKYRGSCNIGANKLCSFKYRGSCNIGANKLCSFKYRGSCSIGADVALSIAEVETSVPGLVFRQVGREDKRHLERGFFYFLFSLFIVGITSKD